MMPGSKILFYPASTCPLEHVGELDTMWKIVSDISIAEAQRSWMKLSRNKMEHTNNICV